MTMTNDKAFDPRIMQIKIYFDNGNRVVTYNQEMDIQFTCEKNILSIQNYGRAIITNAKGSMRADMMSQFNQFKLRTLQTPYCPIEVYAGRHKSGLSLVYKGNVIKCSLTSPPDIALVLDCATMQIDKTKYVTNWPPPGSTHQQICQWAAGVLNRRLQYAVNSKIANTPVSRLPIKNFGAGQWVTAEAIPMMIQVFFPDQIAVYVDDDRLVVKDIHDVVPELGVVDLGYLTGYPFIGIPEWTEYGIRGKVLFNPKLLLGCGVNVDSIMNPTINGKTDTGQYVVGRLAYELTSRQTPFYATFTAYPVARTG